MKKSAKIVNAVKSMFQDATTMFWRILTVVVSVFTLFIIGSSVVSIIKLRVEIRNLERTRSYYENRIAADSIIIHQLTSSDEYLEKFAREHYNMQHPSEDIYLFEK
ncbi:MAG: septum formation initiator family protein [Alistipes sp.]|nr:septum formation initiator family protein [Alistipes sp.]